MAEQLYKLSPHRDLQCYFLTPSAIAAMSQASESGFTVSGKWRQQFDWAVVEWNRDNVFEHAALRYLPDGDLSGLTLTYVENRVGCIPVESNLVPIVDWSNLRIWAPNSAGTSEQIYHVDLAPLSTPVSGAYVAASATMTLSAAAAVGKRVGVALLENHHYYVVQAGDTLESIAQGIATAVNGNSNIIGNPDFSAVSSGASVVISWKSGGLYPQLHGANGNRITVYGFAEDGAAVWASPSANFTGGQFPSQYRVTIDFGQLKASGIPTDKVRKLRWTWAADLQEGAFQQTEFQVSVSEWTVAGQNRTYSVAGPGSRRIEDTDAAVSYRGTWTQESGNYSGSRISKTSNPGDSFSITYTESAGHELYLGTRLFASGATIAVTVDGQPASPNIATDLQGEDVLVRTPLGSFGAGSHTVSVTHAGAQGSTAYFDFLEIVYPAMNLPDATANGQLALATDWDTYHSQSLPAERTAWLINKLGFKGRVNHYTGALWFYELVRPGMQYASLSVTFSPQAFTGSPTVVLNLTAPAVAGEATPVATSLSHLVLVDDTPSDVAQAFAGLINLGTNLVWAGVNGDTLVLTARALGSAGNGIDVRLDASSQGYTLVANSTLLSGGIDGAAYDLDPSNDLNTTLMAATDFWRTDLAASPRINRAARDWHAAYYSALKSYGIDVVAAFSTELMNGDPSAQTGIAQRYPDGSAVVLNTPAIQTNFSATSLSYWKQVYLEMAALQQAAGLQPYLQSGEVQWWYFPKQTWNAQTAANVNVGMPFYDAYTDQQFQAKYGVPMQTILSNDADPAAYPNEVAFLPTLIGAYTAQIRSALLAQFPDCRYEVLYPTDTNDTPLNQAINFPDEDWTAANLNCLKTESFTFTGDRNLDQSAYSMGVSASKGFPNTQRSHLVGIGDATTAWMKEVDIAQSEGLESVVLFALDQYCLIGYAAPPFVKDTSSQRQG